jgi:hypothetical protein
MQPTNINSFDIQPIMSEVEKVIQCGLNKLLVNYIERYELLERTHQQLLQLPSINEEFQLLYNRKTTNLTKESETNTQVYNVDLEQRLDKVEKRLDAIIPILDKLLNKITHLNDDIQDIKNEKSSADQHTELVIKVNSVEKSSVVKTSENENIEIHIVEEDQEDNLLTKEEVEEEKECGEEESIEEEQEEEEQEEEEQEEEVEEEVEEQEEEVEEEEEQEEEEQEDEQEEEVEDEQEEEEEVVEEEQEDEQDQQDEQEEASIETETKVQEEEEEEDEELFEIEIDDKTYCTNNDENGFIWELTEDGEQGEKVGYLKDGEPFFYADEN